MSQSDALAILCCPEDHSALTPASELLLAEINRAIRRKELRNRAGKLIEQPYGGALARASGDLVYPIIDGIRVLIREEAIMLEQLPRGQHGSRSDLPHSR